MESYTVVAFIFVLVFANGMALKCRNCLSSQGFDECERMGQIVECNATIVNEIHEAFKADNPTLTQGNGTAFQCFRFQAARLHPNNTDTGLRAYGRGCTFLNTTFCSGWISSVNMTSCTTCTTDNCDQNPPVVPTAVPDTTTQQPGQPTTTTSSPSPNPSTTTTTKKPSNGANAITRNSLTSLGCLSILFALAAAR
uniref:Salivary secreted peptide n=1 Tax=Anopheles maculatus TaxID=74869 RepID=A0A182T0B3_9DIPT